MSDWTYNLSDGETGTVPGDDLTSALAAARAKATNGRTVTLVQRVETPEPEPEYTPPRIRSAAGKEFDLVATEAGAPRTVRVE